MAIEGTLTLSCTGLRDVVFDTIPAINEQISASITRVPIVTFRADQAFAFDAGTTSNLSFTIIRTQKPDADDDTTDSRLWTNAKFEEMLVKYIDRWQAETDGCTLEFVPMVESQRAFVNNSSKAYAIHENVYLSNLTIRYDKGIPETLYINFNANIGTMTAQLTPSIINNAPAKGYLDKIYEKDAIVTMTSSDGANYYVLYFGLQTEWSCVSSYSVKCGPEQPFPVLTLNLSKKNLSAVAPNLVEDIIPGKNRIFVEGIGEGEYIVTKTSSSGQNYKIVAYSIYEQYRATPVGNNYTMGQASTTMYKTPFDVIIRILTDATVYGVGGNRIYFPLEKIIYCFKSNNNKWETTLMSISSATDTWYVLNMCALRLGCKIWFVKDRAYVVDTSVPANLSGTTHSADFTFQTIADLYVNMDLYEPETPTQGQLDFAMSVCGETELGDEGSDVLKNYTIVSYGGSGNVAVGTLDDQNPTVDVSLVRQSRNHFGQRKEEYTIREINTKIDADVIADLTNERYCDSEQSIGFKLAEMHYDDVDAHSGKYWQPYFSQLARVGTIYDYSKDLVISNKPNFSGSGHSTLPNKLTLSTVEYFYPQGYAEYWFGIICPVDLTQNTSVINNIVYNG